MSLSALQGTTILVAVASENNILIATNAEHTQLLNKVFSRQSIITKPNEFNYKSACLCLLLVSFSLSSFFQFLFFDINDNIMVRYPNTITVMIFFN